MRRELTGRANTAVNLVMFTGSFATQWGIGVVVDGARTRWASTPGRACGSRSRWWWAFVLAYGWFARGWRRHAHPVASRPEPLTMHLHILGICGTFMGGIAAIARRPATRSPAATPTSTRR